MFPCLSASVAPPARVGARPSLPLLQEVGGEFVLAQ